MTIQVCDSIIYDGEKFPIHSDPLFDYLREEGIVENFVPPHTACWRGYVSKWEISNNKLYLIEFYGYVKDGEERAKEVGLDYLFPRKKKVHAKWFAGELQVGKGAMHEIGDYPRYEQEVIVTIEEGNVKNYRTIINRRCVSCGKSLIERPVIQVEINRGKEEEYCYHCAKQVVQQLENREQEKTDSDYSESIKEWEKLEESTITGGKKLLLHFFEIAALLAATVLSSLVFVASESGFFAFTIWVALIWFFYKLIGNKHYLEQKSLPAKPTKRIVKINHHPAKNNNAEDNELFCKGFNRQKIIQRDGRKCQWCGQKGPHVKLEVHHIIPVSQGGDDNVRNLITLCVECHKKETWYGHVHKYTN